MNNNTTKNILESTEKSGIKIIISLIIKNFISIFDIYKIICLYNVNKKILSFFARNLIIQIIKTLVSYNIISKTKNVIIQKIIIGFIFIIFSFLFILIYFCIITQTTKYNFHFKPKYLTNIKNKYFDKDFTINLPIYEFLNNSIFKNKIKQLNISKDNQQKEIIKLFYYIVINLYNIEKIIEKQHIDLIEDASVDAYYESSLLFNNTKEIFNIKENNIINNIKSHEILKYLCKNKLIDIFTNEETLEKIKNKILYHQNNDNNLEMNNNKNKNNNQDDSEDDAKDDTKYEIEEDANTKLSYDFITNYLIHNTQANTDNIKNPIIYFRSLFTYLLLNALINYDNKFTNDDKIDKNVKFYLEKIQYFNIKVIIKEENNIDDYLKKINLLIIEIYYLHNKYKNEQEQNNEKYYKEIEETLLFIALSLEIAVKVIKYKKKKILRFIKQIEDKNNQLNYNEDNYKCITEYFYKTLTINIFNNIFEKPYLLNKEIVKIIEFTCILFILFNILNLIIIYYFSNSRYKEAIRLILKLLTIILEVSLLDIYIKSINDYFNNVKNNIIFLDI